MDNEKKMGTTTLLLGIYKDDGKELGNYYSRIGYI